MLFLLSPLKLIVLFMFYFLPSPSGKVSLKATEGDNKSLLHFALHFYPLSSKSRLRSILPLPPKEEALFAVFTMSAALTEWESESDSCVIKRAIVKKFVSIYKSLGRNFNGNSARGFCYVFYFNFFAISYLNSLCSFFFGIHKIIIPTNKING